MNRTVRIRQSALEETVAHARRDEPQECCGLLLGSPAVIDAAHRARNLEASPTRFLVDPRDHFDAIRAAREAGIRVVGVYHSHPGTAAVPSRADLAEASYPDYLYLIVGLVDPIDVRLFDLHAGNFREVALVPVP